jgi:hypothetical protein
VLLPDVSDKDPRIVMRGLIVVDEVGLASDAWPSEASGKLWI